MLEDQDHQFLAINPKDADAHLNLGNLLKARDNLDEAEAAYRDCLKVDPKYAAAHYNLGILLEDQNDVAGAEAAGLP